MIDEKRQATATWPEMESNMKRIAGLVGVFAVLSSIASVGALAARPVDVGVVGPQGEVILYYRDGDFIVVKICGKNTGLGASIEEARRNCQGTENRVPVVSFKSALRSLVSLDNATRMKPLTPEEVRTAISRPGPAEEQYDAIRKKFDQRELDQIDAFIRAHGPKNANLDRREQLIRDLATHAAKSAAIKAANDQIDRTIELISNQSQVTIVEHGADSDRFLFTALRQFDASKAECGADEFINAASAAWLDWMIPSAEAATRSIASIGIEDRIRNCAVLPGSSKTTSKGVRWDLVARRRDSTTGKFYEVWKDSKSGLIWGDRLDGQYPYKYAVALAASGQVSQEIACGEASTEARRAHAGISEKQFGMPTIEEYLAARNNGATEVLPNLVFWFWSASVEPDHPEYVRIFGRDAPTFSYGHDCGPKCFYYSVRCVGR